MDEYDPTSPHQGPPPPSSPDSSASVTKANSARWLRAWRLLSNRTSRWIMAAALVCAVVALSVALATSSTPAASGTPGPSFPGTGGSGASSGGAGSGGGTSNARSGPAAGGTTGTVTSASASGFTVTTSAGQAVTVNEASSTTYEKGTSSTSASAVTTGEPVLVLGTTNGTTITATQVIVEPSDGGSANSSAGQVIPFQRGAQSTSKQVGDIPANYIEGSGTIVSGATANEATEAALAAYPGGVVDRVVQLSNGEYEVHYIGVNWPHHIFVNQSFQVVGAD
jgi:hypothetical protein